MTDQNAPQISPQIFNLEVPILGICWGMQFITNVFGGEVKPLEKREDGVFDIDIVEKSVYLQIWKISNQCFCVGIDTFFNSEKFMT